MFRKKEQPMPVQAQVLNGRYLKVEPHRRGGYVDYKNDLGCLHQSYSSSSQRAISEIDISESYLSEKDEKEISQRRQDIDKLNKSNRRKIPFLQKRKKEAGANFTPELGLSSGPSIDEGNDEENDDIGDITTYNEGIPISFENIKKNGLSPSSLSQAIKRLDLDHQYAKEAQIYERMNYIVENYRPPPPYPGNTSVDTPGKSMMQQLLQEKANKQMKDNASMINYCQVDAPKDLSVEDLTKIMRASPVNPGVISAQMHPTVAEVGSRPASYKESASAGVLPPSPRSDSGNALKDDKLVMRTLRCPRATGGLHQVPFNLGAMGSNPVNTRDIMFDSTTLDPSEIYPRDYDYDDDDDDDDDDGDDDDGAVDLSPSETLQDNRENGIENSSGVTEGASQSQFVSHEIPHDVVIRTRSDQNYTVDIIRTLGSNDAQQGAFVSPYVNTSGYHQHPERDYDLPEGTDYEPEFYEPQLCDEVANSGNAMYIHSHERSETYVPPSPYMNAEIPEWLQVYAKASAELDELIKWDMFRLPELDCWQTMLKRLYMKELEQVVFWFEEYRQSMQHEIKRREQELGILRISVPVADQIIKKSDV